MFAYVTANDAVKVDNKGTISKAEVKADDVVLDGKKPTTVDVAPGTKNPTNSDGKEIKDNTNSGSAPSVAYYTAASEASVPVVMHLDHGSSYELAMQAFRAGYTSVMIDGSHHVFEENIEITKSVVRACHAAGIPVEAELGKVGGKEDDLDGGNGNGYTVPSEAAEFAERTGVDSLAVAIGTAHGVYKGTPKLDMERLSEIRKVVSVPLVLHGTSGVPDDAVRECVARGMCKVNYATDLRIAFSKAPHLTSWS